MAETDGITLQNIGALLHKRRILLFAGPGIALVLAILVIVLGPRQYVAYSEFLPEKTDQAAGGASALASEFGIQLGSGSGESPYLYLHVLSARELLDSALMTTYNFPDARTGEPVRANLLTLLRPKGKTPQERLNKAVQKLSQKNMYATVEPRANMVLLQTRAVSPLLAEQMNRRLLDLVNQFNLERRQTRAKAERQFVETRMKSAEQELRSAEGRLGAFLEENRRYQQSPALVLEEERLSRAVAERQQVYTTLAQGYEQARIEEVRNTPAITVVSSPEGSGTRASSPAKLIVLALIAGTFASLIGIFVLEAVARMRAGPGTLQSERA